jgi:hypothetical protein
MSLICPLHYCWTGSPRMLRSTIGPRVVVRGVLPLAPPSEFERNNRIVPRPVPAVSWPIDNEGGAHGVSQCRPGVGSRAEP